MVSLLIAFLASLVLTPVVIRIAHSRNWIAQPRADRWHSKPTALMGGIAIYAGFLVGVLTAGIEAETIHVVLGCTLIFIVGIVDDRLHIKPATKLAGQVTAAGVMVLGGHLFGPEWPYWISVPLTFFWIIGITNAFNLLDNMDGLAAGIAFVAAVAISLSSVLNTSPTSLIIALAIAGAAAGFLPYNTSPARIFMGDGGSLFLGYSIASVALLLQREGNLQLTLGAALVPIAVLAVPILDTTLVTIVRLFTGRSVAQGGRDHLSHRLVLLGLTERWAVLSLWAISMICGSFAILFKQASTPLFLALLSIVVMFLSVFGIFLGRMDVYEPRADGTYKTITLDDSSLLAKVVAVPSSLIGPSWKILFFIVADVVLISSSLALAFFLRFDQGLTGGQNILMGRFLPVVITVKVLTFYAFRIYGGLWDYAGTPEAMRISGANLVASLLCFGALSLLFGMPNVSRGVLFIDWMLTTITTSGVRFSFRALRQHLASQLKLGKRVVLYGAGDAGLLALREMRQNRALGRTAVGFLDDDKRKIGRTVQGLEVLGSIENLEEIVSKHGVEEVVLTSIRMPEARIDKIIEFCHARHIPCSTFTLSFRPIEPGESVSSSQ